jgi:ankyrin repeat protein
MNSMEGQLLKAVEDNRPEELQLLLDQSGLQIRNKICQCADVACQRNLVECLEVVLSTGLLNPGEKQKIVHTCCRSGSAECLSVLICHGIDIEDRDNDGRTPLMVTVSWAHPPCVEMLLKTGAQVDARNANNLTSLHVASEWTNKIVDRLVCASLLLDNGADVNALDGRNRTPLHIAAMQCNKDLIDLLLRRGAEVGIGCVKTSIKMCTVNLINISCLKSLLEDGVDLNQRIENSQTVLMQACSMRNMTNVIQLLILFGADVTIADDEGLTATDIAGRGVHAAEYVPLLEAARNLECVPVLK